MSNEMVKASSALANVNESIVKVCKDIESVVADTELALKGDAGKITRAFKMAAGMKAIRAMITDQMMNEFVMPLMNNPVGFKTDKDPKRPQWDKKNNCYKKIEPYAMEVVKDCIITVMLKGGNLIGNEFNIISGQAYFTKEFFMRAIGNLPGVTDVVSSPGVPKLAGDGKALIRYGLSWKVNGVAACLKDADGNKGRVFEIRTDSFSSTDQIIGKADRKAYAAAYRQIVGSELAPPEGDVDDVVQGTVVASEPAANSTNDFIRQQQEKKEPSKTENPQESETGGNETAQEEHHADQQQQNQETEQGQENPDPESEQKQEDQTSDKVDTYPDFFESVERYANAQEVDPSIMARGIGMALMAVGCKGKGEKTTVEWRTIHIAAIRDRKFDWSTGKIKP